MALPARRPSGAALVTGASAGIGVALATELASRKYGLVLVARRKERLDDLAAKLAAEHGVRVDVVPCDLADAAARAELPGRVAALEVEVDILVNNAGLITGGPFHESDLDRELMEVRVLVEAPMALTRAFLPGMVERGAGGVLNVASTAAFQPLPYSTVYSACKAFALTFSEALHQEVRGRGVAVTALCPGPVDTELWEMEAGQPIESAVPRVAWVSAEDVAKAGINGLAHNRRVVVPGLPVRASLLAARYIPHAIKLPVTERLMRRR